MEFFLFFLVELRRDSVREFLRCIISWFVLDDRFECPFELVIIDKRARVMLCLLSFAGLSCEDQREWRAIAFCFKMLRIGF
jgi:hypothetical protein